MQELIWGEHRAAVSWGLTWELGASVLKPGQREESPKAETVQEQSGVRGGAREWQVQPRVQEEKSKSCPSTGLSNKEVAGLGGPLGSTVQWSRSDPVETV